MRHVPEKRQGLAPPAGLVPLMLAAAAVLVALAVVMALVA
jgi:hypothetical protein